eukprot:4013878-Pyramimonas_sp.AAC.1
MTTLAAWVKAAIDDVRPKVKKIISDFRHSADASKQIKACAGNIISLLMTVGLATSQVLDVDSLGCHPCNRFGVGVGVHDTHKLLNSILAQGWLTSAVQNPTCFEIDPNGAKDAYEFQKRLVGASDGYLADICDHRLRYMTVSCSHTLQGVRAVRHKARTDIESIATGGRISLDRVLAMCESYKEPLEKGWAWTVIKWEVDCEIPELAPFLQEAFNAGHGTERTQTF